MLFKIVALIIFFISFSVNATLKLQACNGCSDTGMMRAAEFSQKRMGSSYVAVVNFRNSTAQKFYTSLQYDSYGEPVRSAIPVGFTAEEQHDIDLYFQYRNELAEYVANFSEPLYELPSYNGSDYTFVGVPDPSYAPPPPDADGYLYGGSFSVKGDPYTFLSASYNRNDAYDFYMTGAKEVALKVLDSSLQTVEIPTGKDLDIYIDIVFYESAEAVEDGEQNGKVKVVVDTINEVFQIMSAKDSDNNSIPIDRTDLQGDYRFKLDKNSEVFLNYINLLFDSGGAGGGKTCSVTSRKATGSVGNEYVYYQYKCT